MTIALVLASMTILNWITVETAAKSYLVLVGLIYVFAIIETVGRKS